MQNVLQWFTGGEHFNYHNLFHCMDHDMITIALVVCMAASNFIGYTIIAYRWSKAAAKSPESEAKKALSDLKWIFILCAICGYLWICVETVWPAWRLMLMLLIMLNGFTWRYVLRLQALEGVYKYLTERGDLVKEIEQQRAEIEALRKSVK